MVVKFQAPAPVQPTVTITGSKKAINTLQKAGLIDQISEEVNLEVVVPKAKTKAKNELIQRAEEFIGLYAELEPALKKLKRYEELKKQLSAAAKDQGAETDKPWVIDTEVGTVEFSRCVDQTVVTDREQMLELLGPQTAQLIAQYNLGDVQKYLSENELAQITQKQPGPRKLVSVKTKP